MLWKSPKMYEKYDPGVARAALLTFRRHLRYLTEEALTSCLFFKNGADSKKKKNAASLMKYKANEKSLPTVFPAFPVLNHTTKLHHLVGLKS
ncbi:hypothetical protein AVEN_79937-1 [Araneus ventricosus]|uniref:Uncharacterized protein n=1 Tax=Araneus ventricosus TaxID=182803 RepID=A0A4Y2H596_ARAVE|nr:hypothetical protein AVEN_188600-1 [Araneus ventricosus]GBM60339.1 hypothetical protein AVEN_79937-1 [Araneus ventricosus]